MRRSSWPAEPLRPGNSPRFKAPAMVRSMGRIEHVANPPTISNLTARMTCPPRRLALGHALDGASANIELLGKLADVGPG
jgi:hypothetical protein